jgi:hypothetical protein
MTAFGKYWMTSADAEYHPAARRQPADVVKDPLEETAMFARTVRSGAGYGDCMKRLSAREGLRQCCADFASSWKEHSMCFESAV